MALNPPLSLPYTFVNGTIIDANQVNADFAALTNSVNSGLRVVLTATATFYVAPGGADVPGNGLSPTSPAGSVGFIIRLLQTNYDLGTTQEAHIQLANGTYNENVLVQGPLEGQGGANQLTIQGNAASPNLVTFNGDPCFDAANGALLRIQDMTLTSSVSSCIISQQGARVAFVNCIFAATIDAHLLAARGGQIRTGGNYTIAGGGGCHIKGWEGGEIFIDQEPLDFMNPPMGVPTVTLTGTPNFSNAFIDMHNLSLARFSAAFSGAATGVRSITHGNSVINLQGQGTTYLPGSIAGTDNTGGVTA